MRRNQLQQQQAPPSSSYASGYAEQMQTRGDTPSFPVNGNGGRRSSAGSASSTPLPYHPLLYGDQSGEGALYGARYAAQRQHARSPSPGSLYYGGGHSRRSSVN